MRIVKNVLLALLVFLPLSVMEAQETEMKNVNLRVDSLAEETATLDKIVKNLSKFKVSAYIQGQYQYGQQDATLKVGDKNEHIDKGFNRIGIRRGRLKFEYNDGIGTGVVQIDVNDKGISFRDLYIGIKDPWTKRNQLMAGVFNRPFGHEVGYSTSGLESTERATIIQYFFPDERDLGVMLTLRTKETSPLGFLRLDAGLFAGNSINRETDSRKDFIGRLSAKKKIGDWGKWGAGFSYYHGFVYNSTDEAYEMDGKRFIRVNKKETGTYMKRQYIGADAQFSFFNVCGTTTLRAEGLLGTQPGIASSSRSPNSGNRPEDLPENSLFKRPFLGYFFYLIQDIGRSPFSAIFKYDVYDPNTKVKGNEVGVEKSYTSKTDLKQSTFGFGAIYNFSKHIRLQAYYEFNFNEKSTFVKGYENDRKDNVLTVRLQYKF
ncbi:hypothetical protein [Parabacteroides bouchesdurhonensis]|uniref:hypothetical protein n=1 Tax=Parabacteroides bouchesdurhonensis TaxID=1936995 RepID=UPI000E4D0849|nr:hypothetical protein [Parabacteroides bouchesdurhonensis]RHJ92124.1 hypothetical protein DW095_08730 [Bacteroides sp. AM07-16]